MEPLTALSIASSAVQLVDFGGRLFRLGAEIRRSSKGAAEEIVDLELVTSDLLSLSEEFRTLRTRSREDEQESHSGPDTIDARDQSRRQNVRSKLSKDEEALLSLADRCFELSEELLVVVAKVKGKSKGDCRTWQALLQAIRTVWKEDKIQGVARRLEMLKSELLLRLVYTMRDQQACIHQTLQKLIRSSEDMKINHTASLDSLRAELTETANNHLLEIKILQLDNQERLKLKSDEIEQTRIRVDTDEAFQAMLDAVLSRLQDVFKTHREVSACQSVLRSLEYNEMPLRHIQIPEAYDSTFAWIFDSAPFGPWLQTLGGVFWVTGKAGSGKSTLMKFLCDDRRTESSLRLWAGDKQLVRANYFFWSSGFAMQKSQEGLLRSLLYQLMRQCPDVIPIVCPKRCTPESSQHTNQTPWTIKELMSTLRAIIDREDLHARFCFFIDGLDEYSGDHHELIEFFAELKNSAAVKMCVSSRPWNAFRKAYDNYNARIVMQDLTKGDMDKYIKGSLKKDSRFQKFAARESDASILSEEIRTRAQGVFLWVVLTVRSLLNGLTEDDNISELLRRLHSIPDTLEESFKMILKSVDKIYQRHTARALLIASFADSPLPLMSYHYLEQDPKDLESAIRTHFATFEGRRSQDVQARTRSCINKWCRDLLEVTQDTSRHVNSIFREQIVFLHRTVQDFLKEDEMRAALRQQAGADFKPEVTLATIFLIHVKNVRGELVYRYWELDHLAANVMYYLKKCEIAYGRPWSNIVLALDDIGKEIRHVQDSSHWTDIDERNERDSGDGDKFSALAVYKPVQSTDKADRLRRSRNILAYAVEFDLILYVKEQLVMQPAMISRKKGAPLLFHALSPEVPIRLGFNETAPSIDMIKVLLERSADPNEPFWAWDASDTIWRELLRCIGATYDDIIIEDSRFYQDRSCDTPLSLTPPSSADENFLRSSLPLRRIEGRLEHYKDTKLCDQTTEELFRPLKDYIHVENSFPEHSGHGVPGSIDRQLAIVELLLHHGADTTLMHPPALRWLLPRFCQWCQSNLIVECKEAALI